MGKAVPLNKLALDTEFFTIKNGTLYWSDNERSRKTKGQIILRDVDSLVISPKNPLEIVLLYSKKLYKLESDSKYNAEKWFNSLKMVKEMGDLDNLDPTRYEKLSVYTRSSAKIVFKSIENLVELHEIHIIEKIVHYKYDKIFMRPGGAFIKSLSKKKFLKAQKSIE